VKVQVLHNQARDAAGRHPAWDTGYEPGHPLCEVFAYETPDAAPQTVAERAFWLFNVGDEPAQGADPTAVAYRRRQLRSLSIGDVLVLTGSQHCADGPAYACGRWGWTQVALEMSLVTRATRPGIEAE